MSKKKTSATQKACSTRYKNDQRWKTNRIAKLEKHLEKHPDDAIAKAAIAATKSATEPRRTGYKSKHPNRTSGQLVLQLRKIIKGAAKAAQFEKGKADSVVQAVTEKAPRKPRHKAAK